MSTLDYRASPKQSGILPLALGISACAVGLAGHILGMLASFTLRHVPPGSSIRPMGLAFHLLFIWFATAVGGVALGIIGIVRGRHRMACWLIAALGIALSLTPLFTSRWVWNWIVAKNGLIMES